jgi:hypothetical protein
LQLGLEHQFNERLTANVAGGIFYNDSTASQLTIGTRVIPQPNGTNLLVPELGPRRSTSDTSVGALFNASLVQRGERTDYKLAYSRTLAPTGLGVLSERNDVNFSVAHRFTERLTGSTDVSYLTNSFVGQGAQKSSSERIRVGASASYNLTRFWSITGGYSFIQIDQSVATADGHTFFLGVSYSGDKKSISR